MAAVGATLQSGTRVSFRREVVVCPGPDRIGRAPAGTDELTGDVVLVSDYGEHKNYFAIVSVDGIDAPLIVPVQEITIAEVQPATDLKDEVEPAA
jgi:hypothetical protein